MSDWKEDIQTISVPKNTGIEGFLHTIKELLKQPRMQEIKIDARGRVTYKRYIRDGEDPNVGIDYEGMWPSDIVRNSEVQELVMEPGRNAAMVLTTMLDIAVAEQMHPLAFVTGQYSVLWGWYTATTRGKLQARDYLCGLPVMADRHIPDTALILCAAFGKNAAFVDTRKSYKIELEIPSLGRNTDVEVI